MQLSSKPQCSNNADLTNESIFPKFPLIQQERGYFAPPNQDTIVTVHLSTHRFGGTYPATQRTQYNQAYLKELVSCPF
jgi:hypothetical protein